MQLVDTQSGKEKKKQEEEEVQYLWSTGKKGLLVLYKCELGGDKNAKRGTFSFTVSPELAE